MALGAAHMLNMWIGCQGANDELMESNRQKSDRGERKHIKKDKTRRKKKLRHLNEPQRIAERQTRSSITVSKQTKMKSTSSISKCL